MLMCVPSIAPVAGIKDISSMLSSKSAHSTFFQYLTFTLTHKMGPISSLNVLPWFIVAHFGLLGGCYKLTKSFTDLYLNEQTTGVKTYLTLGIVCQLLYTLFSDHPFLTTGRFLFVQPEIIDPTHGLVLPQ